tara:strand:- start:97 stop:522 length:426 start_codon:yes stop_codon:yes gene_type:complete
MTYEPQVDDYVIWKRPNGDWEEGWVYFKGDPVDNEKRVKDGWNPLSQYITIETGVKPKKECVYTSGKPMRHKNIHTLLLCNKDNWHELEYVKNRRVEAHYKELAEIQREDKKQEEDKLAAMYKSQDRPLDIDSYSLIPARY